MPNLALSVRLDENKQVRRVIHIENGSRFSGNDGRVDRLMSAMGGQRKFAIASVAT